MRRVVQNAEPKTGKEERRNGSAESVSGPKCEPEMSDARIGKRNTLSRFSNNETEVPVGRVRDGRGHRWPWQAKVADGICIIN